MSTYVRARCRVELEPSQQVDAVNLGNRAPARIVGVTFEWDGEILRADKVTSYRIKKDGTLGTASGGVWDSRVTPDLFDAQIVAEAKHEIDRSLCAAIDALRQTDLTS